MAEHIVNNHSGLTPIIIAVADSTHYLVGATDSDNNLFSLTHSADITVVSSLVEAKQYLSSQKLFSAYVEYQSAYDEMCGSTDNVHCRHMISF